MPYLRVGFARSIRSLAALLTSVALGACGSTFTCADKHCQRKHDFELIAAASLKLIERQEAITTFVVPVDFDPMARNALTGLRPVIAPDRIPQSAEYRLPSGYFYLKTFRIDEDSADFEGVLGPALQSAVPGSADGCGTTFSIPLSLEKKDWAIHSYKTSVCSSTNQIIPVESR
jgi:hypothetical protein